MGPEGICTISAEDSPTGNAMILVANEISGTVTLAEIQTRQTVGNVGATSYTISVGNVENGTVTVSPRNAGAGSTVTVTVNPAEGYKLNGLQVINASGSPIILTDAGNGRYTFTMPNENVTVQATFAEETVSLPFADVQSSDWYYDSVRYVYDAGMMNGTEANMFSPDLNTTRAMIVTMLHRLENEPSVNSDSRFEDVLDGQYYSDAVAWAVQNDIVEGYSEAEFGPNDAVTREQLVAILYRYAVSCEYDVSATIELSGYEDADIVSDYAKVAMQWAVGTGIIKGIENTLAPQENATCAQVATMLMRFCEYFK